MLLLFLLLLLLLLPPVLLPLLLLPQGLQLEVLLQHLVPGTSCAPGCLLHQRVQLLA